MKVLIIDNYDSFTYNLVQILGKFNTNLIIKKNDEISEDDIKLIWPDKILISPGPGKPEDSKISLTAIRKFGRSIPVLGVCLGHQAIGISFGAKVIKSANVVHGKTYKIKHDGKSIFRNIKQNFSATRYHSLIIDENSIPNELEVSAKSSDGTIMGIRHKNFPIEGIQFHPESILTLEGEKIIENWLNL